MAEKKTCKNCTNGCYPPANMKPMYGAGGMMLVCCKPRKRRQNGVLLVAPDYTCRGWLSQLTEEEGQGQGLSSGLP